MPRDTMKEYDSDASQKHVVSSIPCSSYHYSSISLSPDRQHAVVAGNDTIKLLTLSSAGISELRSFRCSQHFFHFASSPSSTAGAGSGTSAHGDVRETFGLFNKAAPSAPPASASPGGGNIVITDVAWSPSQLLCSQGEILTNTAAEITSGQHVGQGNLLTSDVMASAIGSSHAGEGLDVDSLVAAAGSNGTVVVWHAQKALLAVKEEVQAKTKRDASNHKATKQRNRNQQQHHHQPSTAVFGQPEAILSCHARAVNRLAFNPRKPHLLLTASQDATVKLWARRANGSNTNVSQPSSGGNMGQDTSVSTGGGVLLSFFGINNTLAGLNKKRNDGTDDPPTWECMATFQPKCDAVRDIRWSPFLEDVFAMTTDAGYLVIYDTRVVARPFLKLAAHAGECTCVDWHPTRSYILATGGGRDRSVKVWDVEQSLNLKDDSTRSNFYSKANSLSNRSDDNKSESSFGALTTDATGLEEFSPRLEPMQGPLSSPSNIVPLNYCTIGPGSLQQGQIRRILSDTHSTPRVMSTGRLSSLKDRASKSPAANNIHTLSIGSPVTRLRWRPPSYASSLSPDQPKFSSLFGVNSHDAMLAVATAPVSGTNAVGRGCVGLWSVHRPFLPLSVVQGHEEGPVTDFIWVDSPHYISIDDAEGAGPDADVLDSKFRDTDVESSARPATLYIKSSSLDGSNHRRAREHAPISQVDRPKHLDNIRDSTGSLEIGEVTNTPSPVGAWQHIVSVGKDGRCVLLSFARGVRLINKVPPSVLAVAPFTPFKPGQGSLQLVSIHQDVPSGRVNDFLLTGLRRDGDTARASGVFRELPPSGEVVNQSPKRSDNIPPNQLGARTDRQKPLKLFLSSIDSCESFGPSKRAEITGDSTSATPFMMVSPELRHFSHFAKSYKIRVDAECPTRSSLCLHNANVAEGVHCGSLERMWKILASILKGSDFDDPSKTAANSNGAKSVLNTLPTPSAFSFLLWPTLRKLLTELADAGNVQTCVAICGIMDVMVSESDSSSAGVSSRVPGIDIELVREWFLSYIEILQQHGLFLISTELIRTCHDPLIGGLNKNSTTIHESCSSCGKPLQGVTTYNDDDTPEGQGDERTTRKKKPVLTTQRACGYCRKKIGLCFLCQAPVKDVFVWCAGCGHGGHLDHAAQWFGHEDGQMGQESCPTGCGHRCNLVRQGALTSAFPIWMSFGHHNPDMHQ